MFNAGDAAYAYYEPEAGYVRPETAVAAQLGLAARMDACVRLGEPVVEWRASSNGARVRTADGVYDSDWLVLCPGPWINGLFAEGRKTFAVFRQLVMWFPITVDPSGLRGMPIFVWDFGGELTGFVHLHGFYGLPPLAGSGGGLKVGTEQFASTTEPDGAQHPATAREAAVLRSDVIGERLPWLGSAPLRSASCLYTSTRGSRFVIDRHPAHDNVMIVSACSGHGFKHSPAIGELVARLITSQPLDIDLEPFRYSRGE